MGLPDRGHARLRSLAFVGLFLLAAAQVAPSFGQDAEIRKVLAPSGSLKAALYPGTPTSIIKDEGASSKGVGFELGRELARRLGVTYAPMVLANNAEVQKAIETGTADVAFTNASPARALVMDFGPAYIDLELGYLVAKDSGMKVLADVDQPGRKIGVASGSTSQGTLSRDLKQGTVVPVPSVGIATEMLAAGTIDTFATNNATLYEMADKLPGARLLEGRWGVEHHAIAVPKGRDAAKDYIRKFTESIKTEGLVAAAIGRAGLRGAVVPK